MANKMDSKGDICIVGAGIGGLATGALLAKQGYNVKIFEREQLLGGRTLSLDGASLNAESYKKILSRFQMHVPFSEPSLETIFDKKMLKGYTLDLGFHIIEGGSMSNVGRVILETGNKTDMLESKLGFIMKKGFIYPLISRVDKIRFLPNILRLFLSGESTMKNLDSVPIADTIKQYGKGKMKLVLELLPRVSVTVNDLDKISTGESFRISQSNLRHGSSPVGYPKKGLMSLSQALAASIEKNGGKICLGTPVKQVLIEDEKAVGVIVDDEEYYFNTIVSNVIVQKLFNVANEKHFPTGYVRNIKSLQGTGSLCAYYSLKKVDSRLLGKSFLSSLQGSEVFRRCCCL